MTPIAWHTVVHALDYYQGKGFRYIETPWVVSREATNVTIPSDVEPLTLTNGYVPVGSAEQGFVELLFQGDLKPGNYVSAGPCFRPQDIGRPFCQGQFFKVELISIGEGYDANLIEVAQEFVRWETGVKPSQIQKVPTDLGEDLELNGIEIGSYGTRNFLAYSWTYGTGLAEPRFTQALKHRP